MNAAKPKNFFVATRNGKNRYIHDIGEECEYNVYDFFLYIGYRCSNSTNGTYNCSLRKEDERYTGYNMYEYFLNYNGTKIDHYNKYKHFPAHSQTCSLIAIHCAFLLDDPLRGMRICENAEASLVSVSVIHLPILPSVLL